MNKYSFYEFFCGGGMARAGLGPRWQCTFANEWDEKKAYSYRANWKAKDILEVCDVGELRAGRLPGCADLAWASSPCQDLSLAGAGAGLEGSRSGAFWSFWRLMRTLTAEQRGPRIIILENVYGLLSSHDGRDFSSICSAYFKAGYRVGALSVDASHFVPQSRPRLFVIGVRADCTVDPALTSLGPDDLFHSKKMIAAHRSFGVALKRNWIWWRLPAPSPRSLGLQDVVEQSPSCVTWHATTETRRLLRLMDGVNRRKVREAQRADNLVYGTVHRRMRVDSNGKKVQRAEVRFDDTAGCLRTPTGGSSRQFLLEVDGPQIRSRLLSSREAARLMGLPDSYVLPSRYTEAYHLAGDGVAVPVVSYLAKHIFEPLLSPRLISKAA